MDIPHNLIFCKYINLNKSYCKDCIIYMVHVLYFAAIYTYPLPICPFSDFNSPFLPPRFSLSLFFSFARYSRHPCVYTLCTSRYTLLSANPLQSSTSSISARSSTRIRFVFRDHEKVASYNAALLNDNIAICVRSMFHLEQFRFTRHVGHIFSYTSKFEYLHL